jgi:TRAP-type C4-dicarboxylate transport system permease small subunit
MYAGMLDKKQYGEITAILAFPYWLAYAPCLISLALLALAALVTLRDSARQI